jgi:hypothetical protein
MPRMRPQQAHTLPVHADDAQVNHTKGSYHELAEPTHTHS